MDQNNKEEKVQKINVYERRGVHGICPDCGSFLEFDRASKDFYCLGADCAFIADRDGNRIWDNDIRDANLKKEKEQMQKEVEDYLNTDI